MSALQTSDGALMYLSALKFLRFFNVSTTVPSDEGERVRSVDIERCGQRGV